MSVRKSILNLIKIYQKTVSPDHGSTSLATSGLFSFWAGGRSGCRFCPTCSEYAYEAISKFGVRKGLILSTKRVLRCHPWNAGGYDPVK